MLNFNDHSVADESNVSGTECGARFTPVTDPYYKVPKFSSLDHCAKITSDGYMLPLTGDLGKLRRATETSDIAIRPHRY